MKRFLSILVLCTLLLPVFPVVADEVPSSAPDVSTPAESLATTTPAVPDVASTTPEVSPIATTSEATTTQQSPSDESSTTPVVVVDPLPTPDEPSTELLVKFNPSVDVDTVSGSSTAADIAESAGGALTDTIGAANAAVVSVPISSTEAAAQVLESNPSVEYAEPNYARSIFSIPTNDTLKDQLWALENTGQFVNNASGTPGDDIKALSAWNISLGTSTVVAVIDSGVLYTHPDLAANMWDGTNCVDENGGALGNCLHGYDFADNDKDPLPVASTTSYQHGTHVAGIIAAVKNNNAGIIGVAPNAKIMALRFDFDVASEVRAIDFARQNGAKIINASYGGTQFSQSEYDAIKRFTDAGGIFVASAGNSASSSDVSPLYPAAYDLPGIISVAATDQNDGLASFSNYGATTIDIGAPGVNIASTYTDASSSPLYAYADGTSMAAPQVAGVVALIESAYASTTAANVKNDILVSGDPDASLAGKTVSGKRLNAYRALLAAGGADYIAPIITLNGASNITLSFGATYTEQGAGATDNVDATTTVTIGGDTVNTSAAGTYHVTYDAVDQAGNHATQVIRTVTVSAPVISSGGGGGGGGGGGNSVVHTYTGTTTTTTTVPNPARPALTAIVATTTASTTNSTPVSPTFVFTRALSVGSRGVDVMALQQFLTSQGLYIGPITAYFGVLTRAGVVAYQAKHLLPQVGNVGPMTRALLNKGV